MTTIPASGSLSGGSLTIAQYQTNIAAFRTAVVEMIGDNSGGNLEASTADIDTINEKTTGAGVTVDGVLLKDSQVTTDTINEKTGAAGVTVDGVLLKDSQVTTDTINEKTAAAGVTIDGVLLKDSQVTADTINEKTAAAGVTIDGVLLKDSQVTTDTINEKTGAAGVTIDGVQLKDGNVVLAAGKQVTIDGEALSGAWETLASGAVTNGVSTVDITTGFDQTKYLFYELWFGNMTPSADATLSVDYSVNAGGAWTEMFTLDGVGGFQASNSGVSGVIRICNNSDKANSHHVQVTWDLAFETASEQAGSRVTGSALINTSSLDVDGIRFDWSTGTFRGYGYYQLMGLKI